MFVSAVHEIRAALARGELVKLTTGRRQSSARSVLGSMDADTAIWFWLGEYAGLNEVMREVRRLTHVNHRKKST